MAFYINDKFISDIVLHNIKLFLETRRKTKFCEEKRQELVSSERLDSELKYLEGRLKQTFVSHRRTCIRLVQLHDACQTFINCGRKEDIIYGKKPFLWSLDRRMLQNALKRSRSMLTISDIKN